ncbi:flavoprotein, partial [Candidatus Omnitrophota bacterium]
GHNVRVIMTPNATRLIAAQLFESLTDQKVSVEMFDSGAGYSLEHISLAKWADLLVIAPASANTIAKLSCGICDNLLTSVALALPVKTPKLIACAMNTQMWKNPATQKNISAFSKLGNYIICGPAKGTLASFDKGEGVLAPLEDIVDGIQSALKKR